MTTRPRSPPRRSARSIDRLIEAGHWRQGDPQILVVFDAGYDVTRLASLLADLPVELLGRLRSDRVLRFPVPPRQPGANGRPPQARPGVRPRRPGHLARPGVHHPTDTTRYGTAAATGLGPAAPPADPPRRLARPRRATLPVIDGTLIRLQVDRLPGDRDPKPVWLWCSRHRRHARGCGPAWQAFLRRFDLEHTFRLFKQTLGWTAPKLRDPQPPTAGPG